jgi:hypothetical protein
MEKKRISLEGEFYIFKASSKDEFNQLMDDGLIVEQELETAFFVETDTDADFEFKCDIPNSKDYIKAFIFEDGKVLGKYYLSTPQGHDPVELNAEFGDDGEGGFMILGSIYDKEVQYFFELDLGKVNN